MKQKLELKNNQKISEEYTLPDLSGYNKVSDSIFIQSITFDNKKIVDINYDFEVMEVIYNLLEEMNTLREKVNLIDESMKNRDNVLIAQGTLKSIWEEDNAWDKL